MSTLKYFCILIIVIAGLALGWHFYPKANMDFHAAERANTVEAYRHFLAVHPNDQRRQSVLDRIDGISWGLAQRSNAAAVVDAYIRQFPNGDHIREANDLRDNLQIASLPVFVGEVSMVSGIYGGEMLFELDTTNGNYQLIMSRKTVYKGFEESNRGRIWDTTKHFKVIGTLTNAPNGPRIDGVRFLDARVIQCSPVQ